MGRHVRYWVAGASGLIGLTVASSKTFGLLDSNRYGDVQTWWLIAVASVVYAAVVGYRDERAARLRVEAERQGPDISLEYVPKDADGRGSQPFWRIKNAGADAFNITSNRIAESKQYFAKLEEIPHLDGHGGRAVIRFEIYKAGELLAFERQPTHVFQRWFEENAGSPTDPWLLEVKSAVRLNYIDSKGRTFETRTEILWRAALNEYHIRHMDVRRLSPARSRLYQFLVRHVLGGE